MDVDEPSELPTVPKPKDNPTGVAKIQDMTIKEYTDVGFQQIVGLMKAVNEFPSGPTRSLYSAYPAFNNIAAHLSDKVLAVMSTILKHQNIRGNIQRRDNDEKFEMLLEYNDTMLEKINSDLDDWAGIRKRPETVLVAAELQTPAAAVPNEGSWNEERRRLAALTEQKQKTTKLLTARNIVRPQISFKTPVDNSAKTPFEPRLRYKPHSLKPLAILPEYGPSGEIEAYLHPYEFELAKLEPTAGQLTPVQPQKPATLERTPLKHVADEQSLAALLADLRQQPEIAVDLEHHSYRTFMGITCLMQISTRTTDYIVDTLPLRDELHVLNEVFADPRVLKVLHGCDSDVEWLQRDLSLYLVNVFDTHQAAKRLNLARLSLAYVLKHYCHLDVDKTFQLADWRIRPLPAELELYARQDTHYLLYVYDLMRNALLAQANGQPNLLRAVYGASTELCKRRYVKPRIHEHSHLEVYSRSRRSFDNRQLHAMQAIFAWRDHVARQEDESTGYVLPNHMMLHMSEILPREMQGLLACCNPIPPLVRQHLQTLHQIVLKAREQPLVRPLLRPGDETLGRVMGADAAPKDLNGPLYSQHDPTNVPEFRDDLPTLLGGMIGYAGERSTKERVVRAEHASCSAFEQNEPLTDEDRERLARRRLLELKPGADEQIDRLRQLHFVSPYARYLAIMPQIEQQRAEAQAAVDAVNRKRKLCPDAVPQVPSKMTAEEQMAAAEAQQAAAAKKDYDCLPLSEFGKRRREEAAAIAAAAEEQMPAKRARFEINVKPDPVAAEAGPSTGSEAAAAQKLPNGSSKQKQKKKGKKGKGTANRRPGQSSGEAIKPYENYDYSQLAGGSKITGPNKNETTSKFHGKNRRRGHDKDFNKLLTFNKTGGGVSMKRK